MVALDTLNELRQQQKWDELAAQSREHLKTDPNAVYVLRALVQALEKLNQQNIEYENALLRLLEQNDKVLETTYKLYQYFDEKNEKEAAIKYLQAAIEAAAEEKQFDVLEEYWMELAEQTPDDFSFFYSIAQKLCDMKQRQRATHFLQLLLPVTEQKQDWKNRLELVKKILHCTASDETFLELTVDTLKKIYPNSASLEAVMEHAGLKSGKPVLEALAEMDLLTQFLPDSYVRHPDWGVGRVKELDIKAKRVMINFQRKRNHSMDLDLAKRSVDLLAPDDFRVLQVIDMERLKNLAKDNPVELVKILLKSFNGTLNAKEIKEYLMPAIVSNRDWNTWWTRTNTEVKRNSFVSVTGTSTKQYTMRKEAASDEDDLMVRFDEIKSPHSKVDQIYTYLRTTKRAELDDKVIQHFSKKIQTLAPRRKSLSERAELWLANEDLKNYSPNVVSMPPDILDEALLDVPQAIKIIQHLRFKNHQLKFAERLRELQSEEWVEAYLQLLIEPDIQIRDEIAEQLRKVGQEERIQAVVDNVITNFRNFPRTFIWLADHALAGDKTLAGEKLSNATFIERLLLLVDNLTNQAKRRDRDEALWLREVAGDAREIIRRNHYALFKQHIQEADENLAASIYRRAQTNEGLDSRTSSDLTTIVRARFPTLFQQVTQETAAIPEGLLCLKPSFEQKQILLKRLIEKDMPEVVREIETARAHGDLRENAEYHAAKDKQKLLASQVSELQEAMHKAKAVDWDVVDIEKIGFGTQFSVTPAGSDIVDVYIMLGPWESDPDRSVLSYQAPFARAFMGKAKGERVDIDLPLHTGRYVVMDIQPIPDEKKQEILNWVLLGKPSSVATVATEQVEPLAESPEPVNTNQG